MDSSESPVHGQQEGSAYNGHYESVYYHPLFLFNDHGDCLAAKLRAGNVHSADNWDELLVPEIERQQADGQRVGAAYDTREALLAVAGGESSDPTLVRVDAPADLGVTVWGDERPKDGEVSARMSWHRAVRHDSGRPVGFTMRDPGG